MDASAAALPLRVYAERWPAQHPGLRPRTWELQESELRLMVLLAAFAGLRLGELQALRRRRVGLLHGEIEVAEQLHELRGGQVVTGPPKAAADDRTVAIPAALTPELERHLAARAAPGIDGLLFCGGKGQPIRRANFYVVWKRAREEVGLPHLHFQDLRDTGNTQAAARGASTKELMARMGHASPRAALIYQHAIGERDHAIAQALDGIIRSTRSAGQERKGPDPYRIPYRGQAPSRVDVASPPAIPCRNATSTEAIR